MQQEKVYYSVITSDRPAGVEHFPAEKFKCCPGTVLVEMLPPITETDGGILLTAARENDVGCVVAVPDDLECPVSVGDWALLRHHQGGIVAFSGNDCMRVVQYTNDAESDILGRWDPEAIEDARDKAEELKARYKVSADDAGNNVPAGPGIITHA